MANPLLELLEGSAKAAYGFLEEAAASPASANQILRDLAGAGFSIRRQTGLDIIASLRGALSVGRVARLAPPNTVIPESLIPPSPHPLTKPFSFRVKVNNAPIGFPQFINVASATTLSMDQIFSVATSYLTAGDSPQVGGVMGEPPDLTLERGLQDASLFTDAEVSGYAASQYTPDFIDSISQGSEPGASGPEGFGHGF